MWFLGATIGGISGRRQPVITPELFFPPPLLSSLLSSSKTIITGLTLHCHSAVQAWMCAIALARVRHIRPCNRIWLNRVVCSRVLRTWRNTCISMFIPSAVLSFTPPDLPCLQCVCLYLCVRFCMITVESIFAAVYYPWCKPTYGL